MFSSLKVYSVDVQQGTKLKSWSDHALLTMGKATLLVSWFWSTEKRGMWFGLKQPLEGRSIFYNKVTEEGCKRH